MSLHPSTRSWEISRKHVNIIKVIGKGAFSQVAQATVRNLRGSQESITVAVKMLKGMVLMCESCRFLDMLTLRAFTHGTIALNGRSRFFPCLYFDL